MPNHVLHPSAAQTCASHVRQFSAHDRGTIAHRGILTSSSLEQHSLDTCVALLGGVTAKFVERVGTHLRCVPGRGLNLSRTCAQVCAARAGESAAGGGRAAAVRGHHPLLPHEALRPGQGRAEAGGRRPGRPRPHGGEVWQG